MNCDIWKAVLWAGGGNDYDSKKNCGFQWPTGSHWSPIWFTCVEDWKTLLCYYCLFASQFLEFDLLGWGGRVREVCISIHKDTHLCLFRFWMEKLELLIFHYSRKKAACSTCLFAQCFIFSFLYEIQLGSAIIVTLSFCRKGCMLKTRDFPFLFIVSDSITYPEDSIPLGKEEGPCFRDVKHAQGMLVRTLNKWLELVKLSKVFSPNTYLSEKATQLNAKAKPGAMLLPITKFLFIISNRMHT